MNNYDTKFSVGQKVAIVSGFFRGRTGIVKSYLPSVRFGFLEDYLIRQIAQPTGGLYAVKIGFFKTVKAHEAQLIEFQKGVKK